MKMLAGLLILVALAVAPARAEMRWLASDPTPKDIQKAIKQAKKAKGYDGCYQLRVFRALWTDVKGCYTTPYTRVLLAARFAAKQYAPFTEADATPDVVAPNELHVHGFARPGSKVVGIVIAPKGSKDPAKVMRPLRTFETPKEVKDLFNASFENETPSITAVFRLGALSTANEIHILYDKNMDCEDCAFPLDLAKVY